MRKSGGRRWGIIPSLDKYNMELQINHTTKLAYQGKNQAELLNAKIKNSYKSDEWLTFLQAKEKGLKIKKGSKSIPVFKGFGKTTELDKDGKVKTSSAPLGFAHVFNLDCTEKYENQNTSGV